ncbi:MAG: LppP/LprE family lipoprotein [Chloroflexi bacterium]|nr:LppP/LprE family lipoprotein [Chloroflexota bacterium]
MRLHAVVMAVVAVLGGSLSHPLPAVADGAWLDNAAATWNTAGMAIPTAPPFAATSDPRCLEQLKPAESDAGRAIEAAGWKLFSGDLADTHVRIVRGLAAFDGMCRPMAYQVFAFTASTPPQFLGTLSPTPMDARTDGALNQIELVNLDRVIARYSRYKDSDALCCPSAVSTVTYRVEQRGTGQVLLRMNTVTEPTSAAAPTTSGSRSSPAPVQAPAQVPRAR